MLTKIVLAATQTLELTLCQPHYGKREYGIRQLIDCML